MRARTSGTRGPRGGALDRVEGARWRDVGHPGQPADGRRRRPSRDAAQRHQRPRLPLVAVDTRAAGCWPATSCTVDLDLSEANLPPAATSPSARRSSRSPPNRTGLRRSALVETVREGTCATAVRQLAGGPSRTCGRSRAEPVGRRPGTVRPGDEIRKALTRPPVRRRRFSVDDDARPPLRPPPRGLRRSATSTSTGRARRSPSTTTTCSA